MIFEGISVLQIKWNFDHWNLTAVSATFPGNKIAINETKKICTIELNWYSGTVRAECLLRVIKS